MKNQLENLFLKKKSMSTAIILAILLGPLGLIYARMSVGFIMTIGLLINGFAIIYYKGDYYKFDLDPEITLEFVVTLFWLVSIPLSALLVRNHNRELQPQSSDQ